MDYLVLHENLSLFSGDSEFAQLKPLHEDFVTSPVTDQSGAGHYDDGLEKSELQKLLEGDGSSYALPPCFSPGSPLLLPEEPSTPEANWLDMEVDLQYLLPDPGAVGDLTCDPCTVGNLTCDPCTVGDLTCDPCTVGDLTCDPCTVGDLTCDSLDASGILTDFVGSVEPAVADFCSSVEPVFPDVACQEHDDAADMHAVDLLFHDLSNFDVDDLSNFDMYVQPVLSPVSLADVESLLSSEPASPCCSLSAGSESSYSVSSASSSSDSSDATKPCGRVRRPRDREVACPYGNKSDGHGRQAKILDKKLRKKQQNKDAALRYRIKKKAEGSNTESTLHDLEGRNKELKESVEQMTREIKYLKDLMTEVYKAEITKSSCAGVS